MCQNISADCLHDILHELGTITFDAFPFLCAAYTLIGHSLAAETVLSHAWFHIGKPSAAWQLNEQHPALVEKADTVCFCGHSVLDRILYASVNIPPETHDIRIGSSPRIYKRLEFFLLNIKEGNIIGHSVYEVEQQGLTENLLNVGDFFKRQGKWVTAEELAREAMTKAVKDLNL